MNNFSHLQQVLKIVFLNVTVYIHFNTLSSIFVALIKSNVVVTDHEFKKKKILGLLYHWSFLILDHDFYDTLKFKDIFEFRSKKNVVSERNYFYEREGKIER